MLLLSPDTRAAGQAYTRVGPRDEFVSLFVRHSQCETARCQAHLGSRVGMRAKWLRVLWRDPVRSGNVDSSQLSLLLTGGGFHHHGPQSLVPSPFWEPFVRDAFSSSWVLAFPSERGRCFRGRQRSVIVRSESISSCCRQRSEQRKDESPFAGCVVISPTNRFQWLPPYLK